MSLLLDCAGFVVAIVVLVLTVRAINAAASWLDKRNRP